MPRLFRAPEDSSARASPAEGLAAGSARSSPPAAVAQLGMYARPPSALSHIKTEAASPASILREEKEYLVWIESLCLVETDTSLTMEVVGICLSRPFVGQSCLVVLDNRWAVAGAGADLHSGGLLLLHGAALTVDTPGHDNELDSEVDNVEQTPRPERKLVIRLRDEAAAESGGAGLPSKDAAALVAALGLGLPKGKSFSDYSTESGYTPSVSVPPGLHARIHDEFLFLEEGTVAPRARATPHTGQLEEGKGDGEGIVQDAQEVVAVPPACRLPSLPSPRSDAWYRRVFEGLVTAAAAAASGAVAATTASAGARLSPVSQLSPREIDALLTRGLAADVAASPAVGEEGASGAASRRQRELGLLTSSPSLASPTAAGTGTKDASLMFFEARGQGATPAAALPSSTGSAGTLSMLPGGSLSLGSSAPGPFGPVFYVRTESLPACMMSILATCRALEGASLVTEAEAAQAEAVAAEVGAAVRAAAEARRRSSGAGVAWAGEGRRVRLLEQLNSRLPRLEDEVAPELVGLERTADGSLRVGPSGQRITRAALAKRTRGQDEAEAGAKGSAEQGPRRRGRPPGSGVGKRGGKGGEKPRRRGRAGSASGSSSASSDWSSAPSSDVEIEEEEGGDYAPSGRGSKGDNDWNALYGDFLAALGLSVSSVSGGKRGGAAGNGGARSGAARASPAPAASGSTSPALGLADLRGRTSPGLPGVPAPAPALSTPGPLGQLSMLWRRGNTLTAVARETDSTARRGPVGRDSHGGPGEKGAKAGGAGPGLLALLGGSLASSPVNAPPVSPTPTADMEPTQAVGLQVPVASLASPLASRGWKAGGDGRAGGSQSLEPAGQCSVEVSPLPLGQLFTAATGRRGARSAVRELSAPEAGEGGSQRLDTAPRQPHPLLPFDSPLPSWPLTQPLATGVGGGATGAPVGGAGGGGLLTQLSGRLLGRPQAPHTQAFPSPSHAILDATQQPYVAGAGLHRLGLVRARGGGAGAAGKLLQGWDDGDMSTAPCAQPTSQVDEHDRQMRDDGDEQNGVTDTASANNNSSSSQAPSTPVSSAATLDPQADVPTVPVSPAKAEGAFPSPRHVLAAAAGRLRTGSSASPAPSQPLAQGSQVSGTRRPAAAVTDDAPAPEGQSEQPLPAKRAKLEPEATAAAAAAAAAALPAAGGAVASSGAGAKTDVLSPGARSEASTSQSSTGGIMLSGLTGVPPGQVSPGVVADATPPSDAHSASPPVPGTRLLPHMLDTPSPGVSVPPAPAPAPASQASLASFTQHSRMSSIATAVEGSSQPGAGGRSTSPGMPPPGPVAGLPPPPGPPPARPGSGLSGWAAGGPAAATSRPSSAPLPSTPTPTPRLQEAVTRSKAGERPRGILGIVREYAIPRYVAGRSSILVRLSLIDETRDGSSVGAGGLPGVEVMCYAAVGGQEPVLRPWERQADAPPRLAHALGAQGVHVTSLPLVTSVGDIVRIVGGGYVNHGGTDQWMCAQKERNTATYTVFRADSTFVSTSPRITVAPAEWQRICELRRWFLDKRAHAAPLYTLPASFIPSGGGLLPPGARVSREARTIDDLLLEGSRGFQDSKYIDIVACVVGVGGMGMAQMQQGVGNRGAAPLSLFAASVPTRPILSLQLWDGTGIPSPYADAPPPEEVLALKLPPAALTVGAQVAVNVTANEELLGWMGIARGTWVRLRNVNCRLTPNGPVLYINEGSFIVVLPAACWEVRTRMKSFYTRLHAATGERFPSVKDALAAASTLPSSAAAAPAGGSSGGQPAPLAAAAAAARPASSGVGAAPAPTPVSAVAPAAPLPAPVPRPGGVSVSLRVPSALSSGLPVTLPRDRIVTNLLHAGVGMELPGSASASTSSGGSSTFAFTVGGLLASLGLLPSAPSSSSSSFPARHDPFEGLDKPWPPGTSLCVPNESPLAERLRQATPAVFRVLARVCGVAPLAPANMLIPVPPQGSAGGGIPPHFWQTELEPHAEYTMFCVVSLVDDAALLASWGVDTSAPATDGSPAFPPDLLPLPVVFTGKDAELLLSTAATDFRANEAAAAAAGSALQRLASRGTLADVLLKAYTLPVADADGRGGVKLVLRGFGTVVRP